MLRLWKFTLAVCLTCSAVSQAAMHYNLTIVSPVPSRCTHEDCTGQNPFTWCVRLGSFAMSAPQPLPSTGRQYALHACNLHRWDHFFANCTILLSRPCRVDVMVRAICIRSLSTSKVNSLACCMTHYLGDHNVVCGIDMRRDCVSAASVSDIMQAMHFYEPCDFDLLKM